MERDQIASALTKQLHTAHSLLTDYGEVELDEELRMAIDRALRPILERRLVEVTLGGEK